MRHTVTYTCLDGTVYDLSGPGAHDILLGWSSGLSRWELSAPDDSSDALNGGPAECDVQAHVPRDELDGLMERLYRDAGEGGGTLAADGWSRRTAARVGAYDRLPDGSALVSLSLRSRDPLWRKATSYDLLPGAAGDSGWLDLPHDLPYDLAAQGSSRGLARLSSASRFLVRCEFFGPCDSPWVELSSLAADGSATTNRYGVEATAEAGERIVIDPTKRRVLGGSVYLVDRLGATTNLFDRRLRGVEGSGTYVFQSLPAGSVTATWPATFGVTVSVVEERGSLPWT